jgi:hypothetical protein
MVVTFRAVESRMVGGPAALSKVGAGEGAYKILEDRCLGERPGFQGFEVREYASTTRLNAASNCLYNDVAVSHM